MSESPKHLGKADTIPPDPIIQVTGTVVQIDVSWRSVTGDDYAFCTLLNQATNTTEMIVLWRRFSLEVVPPPRALGEVLQLSLLRDALVNKLPVTITLRGHSSPFGDHLVRNVTVAVPP